MDRDLSDDQLDRLLARFLAERRAEIVRSARPERMMVQAHVARSGRRIVAIAWAPPGRQPTIAALLVLLLALAAGAALVGVQPPLPSPDPLSLVSEEVGPGVRRVLDDGAGHELTSAGVDDLGERAIAVGEDGSVWLGEQSWRDSRDRRPRELFRLGTPGAFDAGAFHPNWPDLTQTPDGALWAVGAGGTNWPKGSSPDQLLSFGDGTWTSQAMPEGFTVVGIEPEPDGSVLVNGIGAATGPCWDGTRRPAVVGRLADGRWEPLPELPDQVTSAGDGGSLAATSDGTAWLAIDPYNSCADWAGLLRYDDEMWEVEPMVLNGPVTDERDFAIGPVAARGGTLWVYGALNHEALADKERWLWRLADGRWTRFGAGDGVPILVIYQGYKADLAVGSNGRLWMAFDSEPDQALSVNRGAGGILDRPERGCAGVLSFDGLTWRTHLPGLCANHVAVGPDGRVWVTVSDGIGFDDDEWSSRGAWQTALTGAGLYVIDPEAAMTDP